MSSTQFHSFQSTAGAQRGGSADSVSSALGALSGGSGAASDAQAFARWMAQHRDVQQPAAASALNAGAPSVPANQNALSARSMVATAASATAQAAQRSAQAAATASRQGEAQQSAQAAEKARLAAKQNQSKPPAKQAAPAHEAPKAPADVSVDGAAVQEGKEVNFKTAQGEASAWVQELQPPQELTTSDPAAMLAWLASLTQADGALPAAEEAGSDINLDAESSADTGRSELDLGRGLGARASARSAHEALTDASELAHRMDTLRDSLQGRGQEVAVQEEAGLMEVAGKGASGLEFSAMLARDVARPVNNAVSSSESTPHHTATLATPVDSPDFAQALADRVSMWVSGAAANGPMTAELRLNPAEMGPVHIRIELDGVNAQVDFAAAQADTREAIEASMSLLSGALEEAGLNLSGGGVSDQGARQAWSGPQDQNPQGRAPSWTPAASREAGGLTETLAPPMPPRQGMASGGLAGGLDLYA